MPVWKAGVQNEQKQNNDINPAESDFPCRVYDLCIAMSTDILFFQELFDLIRDVLHSTDGWMTAAFVNRFKSDV